MLFRRPTVTDVDTADGCTHEISVGVVTADRSIAPIRHATLVRAAALCRAERGTSRANPDE